MTDFKTIGPNPREFLKGRRPDEFSDTTTRQQHAPIARDMLEFVLTEITKKKREFDFETFCYHLMQREVCPNLSPQSGPVGGGDSHADSASYEVSGDLAYRYWRGTATTNQRRFAFAFSAQAAWQAKVRKDVEKLMKWPTPPEVIGFVTNQSVSDKNRKKMVDELRAAHGLEVQIFDRAWITSKIVENRLDEMVYTHLHVERPTPQHVEVAGPNDTIKQAHLEELKGRLGAPVETYGARASYMMSDEYLDAAVLSRELEQPRADTSALFAAALAVARDIGVARQIHRTIYQRAWTEYWYFEDPDAAWASYEDLLLATVGSTDVEEWERIGTVLTLLLTAQRAGQLKAGTAEELAERAAALDSVLAGLETNHDGTTTGWRATCARALMSVVVQPNDVELRKRAVSRVFDIVERHGMRPDLPVRRYLDEASIFIELDDADADDELFTRLHDLSVKRTTETDSGNLFLRRAVEAASAGRWKSLLRFAAIARESLWKSETLSEALRATLMLSRAYTELGLPHAALLEATLGCSRADKLALDAGGPDRRTILACTRRLECELAVGACSAAGETAALILGLVRAFPRIVSERFLTGADWCTACELLAQRNVARSEDLVRLGDLLLESGKAFMRSTLAAHIAAGDVDEFVKRGIDIADAEAKFLESPELRIKLAGARDRDAATSTTAIYAGRVLGLGVEVEATTNRQQTVGLALLAAIEAFAGAASRVDLAPWPQSLRINVVDGGTEPAISTVSAVKAPIYRWTVGVPGDPGAPDAEADAVFRLAVEMIGRTFWTDRDRLERVAGFQRGVARAQVLIETALKLAPSTHTIELGAAREPWWTRHESALAIPPVDESEHPGPPTPETERHGGRHLGIISLPQWDAAGWQGVAYPVDPRLKPPVLALIFASAEAAIELFNGLREVVGPEDREKRVAVGLINEEQGSDYHVIVTGNIESIAQGSGHFISVSRGKHVKLTDPRPRAWFIDAFRKAGSFRLVPVVMDDPGVRFVDPAGVVCHVLHHGKLSELGGNAAAMFGAIMNARALDR